MKLILLFLKKRGGEKLNSRLSIWFRRGLRTTKEMYILFHTCDINVVLNAMVKVNQAAILLVSPGQPRHQPLTQQNLLIPKY